MAEETKQGGAPAKPQLKATTPAEHGTVVHLTKTHADGELTKNYMWVEGTGKSKHFAKGDKAMVHKEAGRKLIEKGAAAETTPPPKEKEPKVKKSEEEDD